MTACEATRRAARRRIALLIAAGALANFAEGLGALALVWWVLESGGGPSAIGVLAAVSLAAMVASTLYGGVIVDRYGARRVAVLAVALGVAPLAALAGVIAAGAAPLWLVVGLAALSVIPDGAGGAAFDVRLPVLARTARWPLERVNAADDFIDGAAAVAGAPAAGAVIALTSVEAALWTAVAVGVTAAAAAVTALPRDARAPGRRSTVAAALKWVAGTRGVRTLLVAGTIVVAAFQAIEDVILPVMIAERAAGPGILGWILGAAGLGGLLGAVAYFAFGHAVRDRHVVSTTTLGIAGAVAALALDPPVAGMAASAFVAGIGAGALSPLVSTRLLGEAPRAIRGAVLGAATACLLSLAPAGALLAGLAVDAYGATPPLLALACVVALSGIVGAPGPQSGRPR